MSLEERVARTMDILGRCVTRTPLTPKLLSKPPFRYLHDLLSELVVEHGFCAGLFREEQMNSENVKDKEAKVAYLTALIQVVRLTTGVPVRANPLKIVAGLEPEETNALLTLVGKMVLKKADTSAAVQQVLAGQGLEEEAPAGSQASLGRAGSAAAAAVPAPSRAPEPAPEPAALAVSEEPSRREAPEPTVTGPATPAPGTPKVQRSNPTMGSASRQEPPPQQPSAPAPTPTVATAAAKPGTKKGATPGLSGKPSPLEARESLVDVSLISPASGNGSTAQVDGGGSNIGVDANGDPAGGEQQHLSPASQLAESEQPRIRNTTPLQSQSVTARRPPPRAREVEPEPEVLSKSARAIIIEDGPAGSGEGDDDEFVVSLTAGLEGGAGPRAETGIIPSDEKHGGLVQKILQTKKDLEGKVQEDALKGTNTAAKELATVKEIEELRASIQTLCRSINPLGKMLDYVQEDVDSMNKEAEHWRREVERYQALLVEELATTEKALEPVQAQLPVVERTIEETLRKIQQQKSLILQNEQSIQGILSNLVQPGKQ